MAGDWLATVAADLADLVLPTGCAGCGGPAAAGRYGVCAGCVAAVTALRPHPTRPEPVPAALPPCVALGEYGGVLRELVLAYKDRGRHRLAGPLGRLLATVVAELACGPAQPAGRPAVLVPVPDTAAAARARHGDHLWRLARAAAARLRAAGVPVTLARPVRALPRPDSAGLDTATRAAAATAAFAPRPARLGGLRRRAAGAQVILLDDVVTTGATLAALARLLDGAGVPVAGAAVLAATRRRAGRDARPAGSAPTG